MSTLPPVHQNWGGSGDGAGAGRLSLPAIHSNNNGGSSDRLPAINGRGGEEALSPSRMQPPPTPRKVDVSNMATFEIMELLRARGFAPSGFYEDDKQRLQNVLNEEYLEAVTARERFLATFADAQSELLRKAGEERRERRQENEEAAFLSKHPHILKWVEKMKAGTCGKYFSLAKTQVAGVRFALKSLVPACPLRILDLRHCHLNDDLAGVLAAHLRVNRCIESLDLSENLIGAAGVKALADALEVNDVLKAVSLSRNALAKPDSSGVRALARMLQTNQALMHINLLGTKMSAEELHVVAQGMALNHNVIVFDVDHRAMRVADSRAVADAVQRNRALKKRREMALREQKIKARAAEKAAAQKQQQVKEAQDTKAWVAAQKRERMMTRRAALVKQRAAERAEEERRAAEKERVFRENAENGGKKKPKSGKKKKKK